MLYTKPEVAVLGDAASVIQSGSKPKGGVLDNSRIETSESSYDPEE